MEFELRYYGANETTTWIYRENKFIGEHLPGKTSQNVQRVKFEKQNLERLPRGIGIGQVFPQLRSLRLINCGLKKITRKDLIGLEILKILDLSLNNLQLLPSDLFVGLHQLKLISFNGNELKFVSPKLLQPIIENGLVFADFRNNENLSAFYSARENGKSVKQLMDLIEKEFAAPPEEEDLPDFEGAFENLWTSKEYSDFTIIGGGGDNGVSQEFPVHKNILGVQNSVFAAVFQVEMKEKQTGQMKIDDFTAETVEEMLQFMYTGQLKDANNAMNLYAISHKYDVVKLKAKIEKIILCNIDESNVIEVFSLAHLHNSDVMKRAAFEVIKNMFPNYELKDELMTMPEDLREIVAACRKHKKTIENAKKEFESKMKKFA